VVTYTSTAAPLPCPNTVVDPDLQMGGVHPDPEFRGGSASQKIFSAVDLKIREGGRRPRAPHLDLPLQYLGLKDTMMAMVAETLLKKLIHILSFFIRIIIIPTGTCSNVGILS